MVSADEKWSSACVSQGRHKTNALPKTYEWDTHVGHAVEKWDTPSGDGQDKGHVDTSCRRLQDAGGKRAARGRRLLEGMGSRPFSILMDVAESHLPRGRITAGPGTHTLDAPTSMISGQNPKPESRTSMIPAMDFTNVDVGGIRPRNHRLW